MKCYMCDKRYDSSGYFLKIISEIQQGTGSHVYAMTEGGLLSEGSTGEREGMEFITFITPVKVYSMGSQHLTFLAFKMGSVKACSVPSILSP